MQGFLLVFWGRALPHWDSGKLDQGSSARAHGCGGGYNKFMLLVLVVCCFRWVFVFFWCGGGAVNCTSQLSCSQRGISVNVASVTSSLCDPVILQISFHTVSRFFACLLSRSSAVPSELHPSKTY